MFGRASEYPLDLSIQEILKVFYHDFWITVFKSTFFFILDTPLGFFVCHLFEESHG